MSAGLTQLEDYLGHTFASPTLLQRALTHPSAAAGHYQRLEFLGDRVLGLCVAGWLYELFPEANEGELTRRHTALVRTETLAEVARTWGVEPLIMRGPGEMAPMGEGVLADVAEAVLGALWLEGGQDAVTPVVKRWFAPFVLDIDAKDAKTRLQEMLQGQGFPLPVYTVLAEQGPAHAPTFTVAVAAAGQRAQGTAGSKQVAGQLAAEALYKQLKEDKLSD